MVQLANRAGLLMYSILAIGGISFAETSISDSDLERLAPEFQVFANLSSLDLSGTRITSEGLKHLQAIDLDSKTSRFWGPSMSLRDTQIDDSGIEYLASMKAIRRLDLSGTKIQGEGLKHLGQLTALEELDLSGTPLSGAVRSPAWTQARSP